MTEVVDQQMVVHLYAPTDGPYATRAYRALSEIWLGCRQVFGMRDDVPGVGLPEVLPSEWRAAFDQAKIGSEAPIALQERRGADCQAVLRVHHDVLNLSVALAPAEDTASMGRDTSWWRRLDSEWAAISAAHSRLFIGESRIYLAKVRPSVDASLPGHLAESLPDDGEPVNWDYPIVTSDGLTLWEPQRGRDDRTLRRLVLAFPPENAAQASAWTWSDGRPAIPPLARYLLQAAKMRFHLRVWQRDRRTRELRTAIQAMEAELRRAGHDRRAIDLSPLDDFDALLMAADLRELRRSVEIAMANLELVANRPELLTPGGPFADDRDLARWFVTQLGDDLDVVKASALRARRLAPARSAAAQAAPARQAAEDASGPSPDRARNVFVIYGRDDQARRAVYGFLRELDLRPLDWESLVRETGQTAPFIGDVIARALVTAQAAVVVMTPDDTVRLHSDLWGPDEHPHETQSGLQARPNVLLEMGMALATYPDRTVILLAGDQRPVNDLGGRNYIRLTDTPTCRAKIANRLQLAGCKVDDSSTDWANSGQFADLAAYRRRPDTGLSPTDTT
ncbi:hypothetical protein Acor_80890 [Acrocarpospora corrugata]|uniref:Uncharacterized protein n=1 Tax=Acrocarpospora corrugata TaxID=35763 RepID=A0A5M3WCM8_9ACTN|nr:CATRA conflict system CASPASE/TPR repeat-associated protein [Acrocarpospora corrugata]GES06020.1 hypothetical protein Acor_80890 [Acrocarpospora corrugata]